MKGAGDFPFPARLGESGDADDDDLIGGAGESGDELDPGELTPEDRIAEMEARLQENFDRRLEQQSAMFQSTLATVMGGQRGDGGDAAGGGSEFNLDDLPDPVQDYDQFRARLAERIREHTSNSVRQATDAATQQSGQRQAFDRVWDRFRSEHPDLAKRETLLRAAATEEVDALRGRGVDPATAITSDSDGFISRVAERMQKNLAPAGDGGGKPSAGRTQGASGGSRASSKSGGGTKKPASFIDQLKSTQATAGLI